MPVTEAIREAAIAAMGDELSVDAEPAPEPEAAPETQPETEDAATTEVEPEPEAPPAPEKPKTEDEKRKELSAERLARAISKDEKAQALLREAKADRQAAAAAKAEADALRAEMEGMRQRLRNPETRIKAAAELGLTYEEYTRAYLQDGKRTAEDDIREVKAELERVKQEREDMSRQAQGQQYNAAIAEAAALVESAPEKFPTLYSEHTTQEIRQRFHNAVQYIRAQNQQRVRQGEQPQTFSDEDIASFLETEAKQEYDAKEARRLRARGQAASDSASGKTAGKVITSEISGGSSQRELTREERRALAIKMPWPV